MPVPQVTPQQVYGRVALETGLLGEKFTKKKSLPALFSALVGARCERLEQGHLVLSARFAGYRPETLLRALQERRSLVRTWGPRGALRIVPASEHSLHLAAAGVSAPRWRRFLDSRSNLSPTARLRLLKRLCPEEISKDGLREAFPDATMRLFLLREAAQAGHVLWKEGDAQQAVFVWTRDWLGKKVEPDRDFRDLVERYLHSYGPLGAPDLAVWLGVTVAAARKLLAKHPVLEIQVEGEPTTSFILDRDLEPLRGVRKSQTKGLVVVPPGDPFLLGYKERYQPDGRDGSTDGIVIVDGRVEANWGLARGAVTVQTLGGAGRTRIVKEIERVVTSAGITVESVEEAVASGL